MLHSLSSRRHHASILSKLLLLLSRHHAWLLLLLLRRKSHLRLHLLIIHHLLLRHSLLWRRGIHLRNQRGSWQVPHVRNRLGARQGSRARNGAQTATKTIRHSHSRTRLCRSLRLNRRWLGELRHLRHASRRMRRCHSCRNATGARRLLDTSKGTVDCLICGSRRRRGSLRRWELGNKLFDF